MRLRAARQAKPARYSEWTKCGPAILHRGRERVCVFAKVLVAIAIGIVVLVLAAGVSTLFVEGKKARTWSNRMMRIRVLAQFVAILIIMAVFYFARN